MPTPASIRSTRAARKPAPILDAACWAHGRRKFYELAEIAQAPIAIEAVKRFDTVFVIERDLRRLRSPRRAGRGHLHADRDGEAQRRRSAGLARRRAGAVARPRQPRSPRIAALELPSAQPSAPRCGLNAALTGCIRSNWPLSYCSVKSDRTRRSHRRRKTRRPQARAQLIAIGKRQELVSTFGRDFQVQRDTTLIA